MNSPLRPDRREFLKTTAAVTAASLACWGTQTALAEQPAERPPYKKAVKIGMVGVPGTLTDKFRVLKELGFDGVELDSPGGPSAEEVAQAKDQTGLIVHGVVDSVHWNQRLSDPSPEVRAAGLEALKTAINMSKAYGGTSVLLVPGRVTNDATYQQCWERSSAEIRKAIPLAEEEGIHILMENVWNDFLTDPQETARYIDQFESKVIGAYFDVGNAVRYSPPHDWIPVLGSRIVKLDIKDWGKENGFKHELLEGDVDWPKVMAQLRAISYTGWGTAEIPGGGRERLTEIARRMDRIYAS